MIARVEFDDTSAVEAMRFAESVRAHEDAQHEVREKSELNTRVDQGTLTAGDGIPGFQAPIGAGKIARVLESDLSPDTGSFLDTARSAAGIPQAHHEITPESVVRWNGMDVSVQVLAQMGELVLDKAGNVLVPEYTENAHQRELAQGNIDALDSIPRDHPGRLDERTEDTVRDLVTRDPELAGDLAFEVANAAVEGREIDLDMARFGDAIGVTRLGADGALTHLQDALQSQADTAITSAGVDDVETFYQWSRENHPDRLREAVARQLENAELSQYRALAEEFLARRSA